jgi:hypothetical protein
MHLKKIFIIISLLSISSLLIINGITIPVIKDKGKNFEEFIPKGWKVIKKIEGDFNKDKLIDVAAVIESENINKNDTDEPPRILFILFRQADGSYKLSIQNAKAVFKSDDGGVFGDPFAGLTLDRGSMLLDFYGGSAERWGYSFRFRYQDNGWFLIGATINSNNVNTGEGATKDFNLLTGKMDLFETFADGKESKKLIDRGIRPLLNLKDFDIYSFDESKI